MQGVEILNQIEKMNSLEFQAEPKEMRGVWII